MLPILQHLPHFRLSPPFSPPAYVNAPAILPPLSAPFSSQARFGPSGGALSWSARLVRCASESASANAWRHDGTASPCTEPFPASTRAGGHKPGADRRPLAAEGAKMASNGRPIGKLSGSSTDWDSLAAENYGLIGANPPISPYWFRKSGAGRSGRITVDGHASATHLPDAISSTVFSSFAEFSLLPCAFFSRRSAHCPLSSTPVAFADIHAAGVSPTASTTETPRFLASLPYIYIFIYIPYLFFLAYSSFITFPKRKKKLQHPITVAASFVS